MIANRGLMIWSQLLAGLSMISDRVYQGDLESKNEEEVVGVPITIVLEWEETTIGGWLAVGDSASARIYGNTETGLKLLWHDGGRAHLQLAREGDGFRGNWWTATDFKDDHGENGRFRVRSVTSDKAKVSARIAKFFESEIAAKMRSFFNLRGETEFLDLIAAGIDALPAENGFFEHVARIALALEKVKMVAAWYREAAARAFAEGHFKRLAGYHRGLDALLNISPDWALEKSRAASALPLEVEVHFETWRRKHYRERALFREGSFRKCLDLARDSVNFSREHFGPDHLHSLKSINNLAALYKSMGTYSKALPLLLTTLAQSEKVLGKNHPGTLSNRNNLACLYESMGNYDQALHLFMTTLTQRERVLGENHPDTMASRNNLACLYESMGSYDQALHLFKTTLTQRARVLGESHPATLNSRDNLGSSYQWRGDYDKALTIYKSTLTRRERVLGENHPDTLTSRSNLAGLYQLTGSFDKALVLSKTTLAQRKELLGENHPESLTSQSNLASLYGMMGSYNKALALYKTTLVQSERVLGENHPDTLTSRNNLASLYKSMGNFDEALALYKTNLVQSEWILGESHPNTLTSRNNLAALYESMGNYNQALPLFKTTLAQCERVLGENHPDTLTSRNNLGSLYQSIGSYDKAIALYRTTLTRREQTLGENHPDTLTSRSNLACLYQLTGSFDKALALSKTTLAQREMVLGENHPDTLTSRSNLAGLHKLVGNFDKAHALFKATLNQREKVLGKNHPDTLTSRSNLAGLYKLMGFRSKALVLSKITLAQRERVLGKSHPDTLTSLSNLASLYGAMGRYNRALALYKTTLFQSERVLGESHPDTLTNRNNLAITMAKAGNTQEALVHLRISFRQTNRRLERLAWGTTDRLRHQIFDRQSSFRRVYLSLLVEHGGKKAGEEILYFALQRDGLLRRIATAANQLAHASDDPALRTLVAQYRTKQALFSSLIHRVPMAAELNTYKLRLNRLETEMDRLEAKLAVSIAELQPKYQESSPVTLRDRLGPKTALVSFLAFQKSEIKRSGIQHQGKYLIAIIAKSDEEASYPVIHLGNLAPIAKNIETWCQGITYRRRPDQINAAGRDVYAKIWQPLVSHLRGKDTIYVVADGALRLLPIGALPGPNNQTLSSGIDLVFMDAVHDLLASPSRAALGSPLICYAPNYGTNGKATLQTIGPTRGALAFTDLPGARDEGEGITAMFRAAGCEIRTLTGEAATETALAEAVADETPSFLHLASHGFFLDNLPNADRRGDSGRIPTKQIRNHWTVAGQKHRIQPKRDPGDPLLRSGIALAGANHNQGRHVMDDGLLTALEAGGLALEGTGLVVLSACETGLGDLREGEGVYGLRRAFFLAGARALLATLWRVDDAATHRFMERFYELYLADTPPRDALRQVQREFQAREHDSHPVFWAPFHLIEIPETNGELRP